MDFLTGVWLEPKASRVGVMMRSVTNASAAEAFSSSRTTLLLEVLMALMCIGAITGNIMVIVIVAATKTFGSVTSVLIINLAISDLLVGVGVMPFVALSLIYNDWVDCTDLCLYVGYTSSVYCTASVLTLAAIALDRYYSIADALRYASRCSVWRTGGVVLWIWTQALATSVPPLLGWSSVSYVSPMYSCAVRWASSASYTVFMAALSYAAPAAVILFCYVHIVRVARSHARRIHSLEEYILQRRSLGGGDPTTLHQHCADPTTLTQHCADPTTLTQHCADSTTLTQHCADPTTLTQHCADPTTLHQHWGTGPSSSTTKVYHLSGRFVSEPPSNPPHRHNMLSFLAQGGAAAPRHGQNNHHTLHNHQGLLRLFLVISAFFLCWTPYMGVAVIQAAEAALSAPSRVPPGAVTFSYWLLLLNSDINPLLYVILSKQFQNALRRLKRKVRARLGNSVWTAAHRRDHITDREVDEGRSRGGSSSMVTSSNVDLCSNSTLTSTNCDHDSRYGSSVFTVDTEFWDQQHPSGGDMVPGSSRWDLSGGDMVPGSSRWDQHHQSGLLRGTTTSETLESLQVPSPRRTQEGGRLPYSALTQERQATFFYGQITVRVEHDVC